MFSATLVPCSEKAYPSSNALVWSEVTTLRQWCNDFTMTEPRYQASHLYTGRVTTAMLEDAASHAVSTLIISAGAGLIGQRTHSDNPLLCADRGPPSSILPTCPLGGRVLSEFTMGPIFPLHHRLTMLPSSRAGKWSPTFRGWWSPTPRR